MTTRTASAILTAMAACLLLAACGGKGSATGHSPGGDTLTHTSEFLTMIDRGDYTEVVIADPFHATGVPLAHLALVDSEDCDVPNGCTALRVPLERSVVFSSVHTPVFELGAGEAVTGVADAVYFADGDTVASLLATGHVADVGSSVSPSAERILALEAQAVLLSPMQNSDNSVLRRSGITVVPMADYMERTPLGRAEWIKLLGALYGCEEKADSIYKNVCLSYNRLCSATEGKARPRVLTENLISGVWYVPGGRSYMARMLADAGADYPWSHIERDGSLPLDASGVLDKGADADIWLMRTFGAAPSARELKKTNPAAEHIKAFKNGNVYVCDTSQKNIFNDIAFHPERVLRDFVIIFHPDALPGEQPHYYEKMTR